MIVYYSEEKINRIYSSFLLDTKWNADNIKIKIPGLEVETKRSDRVDKKSKFETISHMKFDNVENMNSGEIYAYIDFRLSSFFDKNNKILWLGRKQVDNILYVVALIGSEVHIEDRYFRTKGHCVELDDEELVESMFEKNEYTYGTINNNFPYQCNKFMHDFCKSTISYQGLIEVFSPEIVAERDEVNSLFDDVSHDIDKIVYIKGSPVYLQRKSTKPTYAIVNGKIKVKIPKGNIDDLCARTIYDHDNGYDEIKKICDIFRDNQQFSYADALEKKINNYFGSKEYLTDLNEKLELPILKEILHEFIYEG